MKEKQTEIIITADDYGFCNEIDRGIINAAKSGLISSIAALPNGYLSKERLGFLKQIQDEYKSRVIKHTDSKVDHLSVGCHFTITSGKPLSKEAEKSRFLTKNGYFREYTKMKRPRKPGSGIAEIVRAELCAQLEHMQSYITVDHLSSHHDSLIFFEDYYEVFLDVAEKKGIPIRSPAMIPTSREKSYYGQIGLRSFDNLLGKNWKEYRQFRTKRLKGRYQVSEKIKSPDFLFGGNYILKTLPAGIWEERPQASAARSKMHKYYKDRSGGGLNEHNSLFNEIDDKKPLEMDGRVVEICAHLIDPDNGINYSEGGPIYTKERVGGKDNPHYYPGVTTSYFDGREIEYRLLEMLKTRIYEDDNVTFKHWNSL